VSLLLLDTASLYFRAFYGVPDSLRSPRGEPVNAIRGLLDTIAFLVAEHRPTRLVACWDDDWRPQWRVDLIASYKAHRVAASGGEDVPADLAPQVPVIASVLEAIGIARVGVPGFEADDVIGTLVAREVDAGRRPTSIMTGDRDLFQLVDDDAGVRVLYPARGVRDPDVVDQARLAEKYGVPTGDAYAAMAVLRGDPSDGLPGVVGIGEKTAAGLLARFGTLDGVLAARDAGFGLTPAQQRRLTEAADYLRVAPTVVRVARDAPVPELDDALPRAAAFPEALQTLTDRWGLRSSVTRVLSALPGRS
jgi:5'-3' exonuclease